MITATIRCYLAPVEYDFTQGYERTAALVTTLHTALPDIAPTPEHWFGGVTSPGEPSVALSERVLFEQRLHKGFPEEPFLITLSTHGKKRRPGGLQLRYMPRHGTLDVIVYRPAEAFGDSAAAVLRTLLEAAVTWERPSYAFVDVYDVDPHPTEPGGKASYAANFATFHHRRCVGWMAYVPSLVVPEQLPTAADLKQVGPGTIVVSVAAPFSIANPEHIQAANEVEMDMNDLGLLPVTDLSF